MKITKRTGMIKLTTGEEINIEMNISAWYPIKIIDTDYLAAKTIAGLSNVNKQVATPATTSITDAGFDADPTLRFKLVAWHTAPHTKMEYMIFHDAKYKDLILIPSIELYKSMVIAKGHRITVSGYGINFSGLEDIASDIPVPNLAADIKSSIVQLSNRLNTRMIYEEMITATLNFSTSAMSPVLVVDFGLPSNMFASIDFYAQINLFNYDSPTEHGYIKLGDKKLLDNGHLIVEIPI